jgi:hypothetical protein
MKARILFFIMLSLLLVRCKDDETVNPEPDPIVFDASAFVQVVDVQGDPIANVRIKVGTHEGSTNEDGFLLLKEIEMNPGTYLTAEKAGYFHGSRRFYPSAGKTSTVKIVLMTEQLVGTIQPIAGGTIQVGDGIVLDFPSNAVVDEGGQAFTGAVSVYAQPIMADDPQLSDKMPGDLVGAREDGTRTGMASFGMVAVELRSGSGEVLQVKDGSTVEMRMEVPSSLTATAPATIPMWYFDEVTGWWKEEGEATLVGNEYVAQLPHFSFWNCDASFETVKLGVTFEYEDGSPASQTQVCITILSLNTTTCSYTDAEGFVCGLVAADEEMLMEVVSPCGNAIYSQQIGPYSDTTMLGPITIPTSSVSFSAISGFAIDCAGNPVTDGFARIKVGAQNYYVELDDVTGAFSISVMNCDLSAVTIKLFDKAAITESLVFSFAYAPAIDAGTITVCEALTEFIDIEAVGFPDHYLFYFPYTYNQQGYTTLGGQDSSAFFNYFYLSIPGTTPGVYTPINGEIGVQLPNGLRAVADIESISLTITYYGAEGDYIIGTLTGTWHSGPNGFGGPDYPLIGNFSVVRQ